MKEEEGDFQEDCSFLPLKAILKNRLLPPLLHTLFPIMAAEPPMGQLDPEDQDFEEEELEIGLMGETPKHFAVQVGCGMGQGRGVKWLWEVEETEMESSNLPVLFQVVDMLALHLPPEKLCPQLVSIAVFLVSLLLSMSSPLRSKMFGPW